jgi:hypothetical protein
MVTDPGQSVDVETALHEIDPTFRPLFRTDVGSHAMGFVNGQDYRVEFLTDASGRDKGAAVPMKGLPGLAAQPLPFLEYLLKDTTSSVLLHEDGVAVAVPDPARYAVHKMIVSVVRGTTVRGSKAKIAKDTMQAGRIVEALTASGASSDLGAAWMDAWRRGPTWRRHLVDGTARLDPDLRDALAGSVAYSARLQGLEGDTTLQKKLQALSPRP